MSRARAPFLEIIRRQTGPVALTDLAGLTRLHANTLRDHLDGLEESGPLVPPPYATAPGPRPPALVFEATGGDTTSAAEYAGLATALAATIQGISPDPKSSATARRQEEYGDVAGTRRRRRPARSLTAARGRVVSLLERLGFTPDSDRYHRTVRLTTCPLLDAARRYPDVVCSVHLGLARGALEYFARPTPLTPTCLLAEPGACVLRLAGAHA